MGTSIDTIIAQGEQAVEKKAAQYAYQVTNNIQDPQTQRLTYTLVRESIILGARMMQEFINSNKE